MKNANGILAIIKSLISKVFVISSLFLLQCNDADDKDKLSVLKSESSGFTKITGYIHNRNHYPNTKDVVMTVYHISGKERATQIKSPINDDGTFYFEIDLARPQDVTMLPYVDFLYLLPDDSLHIELDFKNLLNAQLSGGKSVEINQDFFKYFAATGYRTELFRYNGVGTACEMNCSWEEIRKKMDKERNNYRDRRQSFLQKTSVCEEVVFLTEAMIELDFYHSLVGTIMRRENRFGRETMDKKILMDELDDVKEKYFHSGLYSDTHFKFIGSTYVSAVASFVTPIEHDTDFIDWTKEVAKTDTIRDFMLTVRAGYALLQKDLDLFEKIATHVNNEHLLDRLMQEYRKTRSSMVNPENISSYITGNSKDFTDKTSFDNKNLLAKIIAPNDGKVQVINIGAAWCAPCKPVLEQLSALMNEYSDKNMCVSFICISDDNEETRALYREKGIDDTTVHFTTNDEYQFLAKTFSPLVFPYGILVNRKGVIVDYGTHVRPGEMLLEKINLLLEQDRLIK